MNKKYANVHFAWPSAGCSEVCGYVIKRLKTKQQINITEKKIEKNVM